MSIGVLLTLVRTFASCRAARLLGKTMTGENGRRPSARACIACAIMLRALDPLRVQCRDASLSLGVVHAK
jgi:hypothetical protein